MDDLQLDAHVIGTSRRHQRKLIQGQRPRHPARSHERDLLEISALYVLNEAVQLGVQPAVIDRDRVLVARTRLRTERQDQGVIFECLPAAGVDTCPWVSIQPSVSGTARRRRGPRSAPGS